MTEPLLHLDHVGYNYPDGVGLRDIDLVVERGDRIAIVGANGSGKSTLARILSGELDPSSGTIGGSCIRGDGVGTAADLRGGDPERTVAEVLVELGVGGDTAEALALVALGAEIGDRSVGSLSGGERYRLAVAAQLAARPPILMLDAPTSTLDARSTTALIAALSKRHEALIVLSADLTLAVESCRRVLLLDAGSIVAEGSPVEILTDGELLRDHGIPLPAALSPSWLRRRARRHGDGGLAARDRTESGRVQSGRSSDEILAEEIAVRIESAFDAFHTEFQGITRRASGRFANREFVEHQADAADRLELHRRCVVACVSAVQPLLEPMDEAHRRKIWVHARHTYAQSIAWRSDSELAETFFNSLSRRLFEMVGFDDDLEFRWFGGILLPVVDPGQGDVVTFRRRSTTANLITAVLGSYDLQAEWADLDGDASRLAGALEQHLSETWESTMPVELDMLAPVFYRNRGAYLVGRIRHLNRVSPFVVPLRSTEAGIECDALLLTENLTSRIFGFTRSYFHVDAQEPGAVVAFVKSLIPIKPVAELYTAIGHSAHGKTALFRAIYRHLSNSTDRFDFARGVKGMVMTVFTLPSFGVVFKVTKDVFPPSKRTSKAQVMEKYKLVFKHDRVGRMVDAQIFENLAFPRERFTDELIEELQRECGRSVTVTNTDVIIDHVYTERRVYPLDLYMDEMPEGRARAAAIDYGNAIKDLCAANIFPGDLFTKNFGVTRHGSVVFYDYDELALLDEVNFRNIPVATSYEDEMSADPWFSVGPDDVFPEEFRKFFRLPPAVRDAFEDAHGDLCTAETWKRLQAEHATTEVPEFFPYPDEVRWGEG